MVTISLIIDKGLVFTLLNFLRFCSTFLLKIYSLKNRYLFKKNLNTCGYKKIKIKLKFDCIDLIFYCNITLFFCQCTNSFRKMDLMKCNNLYWVNKLWVYKLVFISAILKLIIICIIIITIKMVNILLVCNSGGLPFLPQSS